MDYRNQLKTELSRRLTANRAYSLRAFARALDMDVAALSRVLAHKKALTPKAARKIVGRIGFTQEQSDAFLASVAADKARPAALEALKPAPVPSFDAVSAEVFHVISEWYHYAILELSLTEGFRSDYRWIGKALGISALEAKLAVERLLGLGLLSADADSQWRKTQKNITTADKSKTSAAHRAYQAAILDKAKFSLENDPIAERSMTGMTMAIDPSLLPVARAAIEEFMAKMCALLETGAQKQVYQLGINLFPLQKKETTHA